LNQLIDQFLDFPEGHIDGPDATACLKDFMEWRILKIKKIVTSRLLGG